MKKLLTLAVFLTACISLLTVYAYADEIVDPDGVRPEALVPFFCVSILMIAALVVTFILRRGGKK